MPSHDDSRNSDTIQGIAQNRKTGVRRDHQIDLAVSIRNEDQGAALRTQYLAQNA